MGRSTIALCIALAFAGTLGAAVVGYVVGNVALPVHGLEVGQLSG